MYIIAIVIIIFYHYYNNIILLYDGREENLRFSDLKITVVKKKKMEIPRSYQHVTRAAADGGMRILNGPREIRVKRTRKK